MSSSILAACTTCSLMDISLARKRGSAATAPVQFWLGKRKKGGAELAKKKSEEKQRKSLWTEYTDAGTVYDAINQYFEDKQNAHELCFGEADLANYLHIKIATLRDWQDGKAGPEFEEVAQWAYQQLAACFETDHEYTHDKVLAKRGWEMMQLGRFQGYKKNEEKTEFTFNVKFGKNCDKSDFE